MEVVEIIKMDGYRIIKYKNGLSKALGSGITAEILFVPGRITPCDFMATVPKGRGVVCSGSGLISPNTGGESKLTYRDDKGALQICPEEDCCRSMLQHCLASAPDTSHLSAISAGSKTKGYFTPKDEEGNISIQTLMLALITAPVKPEFIREGIIKAINQHPATTLPFIDDWRDGSLFYGSAYDTFEEVAKEWILDWIRKGGSQALKKAANLLEKIERKYRVFEQPETDFLDAVSKAATEIFDVPTQKSVWEIWKQDHPVRERQRKQFDFMKRNLGFAWLPAAKRGRQAH